MSGKRVFDLCVLGGGPAGWAGAVRAWDLGKKVCLIERREGLGGAAVWGGAMGKHVMSEVGKGLRKARPHLTGDAAADADARAWAEVRRRTRLAIIDRAQHLDQQLFGLGQTHRFNRPALKRVDKSGTIQRWKGEAAFISPNAVQLEGAGNEVIEAEHFMVATGSVPRPLAKFMLDSEFIVTPQQLLKAADTVPQCVLILGAGMEGCETATVLASLGTPAVHLVNGDREILPHEDHDTSFFIQQALTSDGIKVRRATCAFDRAVGVDCGAPLGQPSCLRVWSRWWVVGGGLQVGGCWWRHVWARADRFTSSTPPSSNTSIPLPRPPFPARRGRGMRGRGRRGRGWRGRGWRG